jgi:hypothetical protein
LLLPIGALLWLSVSTSIPAICDSVKMQRVKTALCNHKHLSLIGKEAFGHTKRCVQLGARKACAH